VPKGTLVQIIEIAATINVIEEILYARSKQRIVFRGTFISMLGTHNIELLNII
jgi:hypothetical protein